MNKTDRIRAFSMRCDGFTWQDIAEALNYDATTVREDLQSVMEKTHKRPCIIYPALRRIICKQYGGSIERFASALHMSPHRLRRVLVYGDKPTESIIHKVSAGTGLSREEAFGDVDM